MVSFPVGKVSGKFKRGLSKRGLGPKGAHWAKKGPFRATSALPPWLWGAEELVPIDPEKAPIGPEKAPIIAPKMDRFSEQAKANLDPTSRPTSGSTSGPTSGPTSPPTRAPTRADFWVFRPSRTPHETSHEGVHERAYEWTVGVHLSCFHLFFDQKRTDFQGRISP